MEYLFIIIDLVFDDHFAFEPSYNTKLSSVWKTSLHKPLFEYNAWFVEYNMEPFSKVSPE